MSAPTDPSFYRTPAEAIAAPPERLAYVAAYDPAGKAKDAMAVIDTDAASSTYGKVVGLTELPTAGNELHHFGWNACSSALCHQGHSGHGQPLERRYLIVPGLRSSRTYVLDTKPDPRSPRVVREIEAEELAAKAGYSRPHTLHCGPGGIFMSALGGANGNDGPGGVALLDHDTFDVVGAWEHDRGEQFLAYDVWWHLDYDTIITSEWATPSMVEQGLDPEDLLGRKFGHHLNFWSMSDRTLTQRVDLGDQHQMVLELRPAHDPAKAWGFVGVVISVEDLSGSIFLWHQDGDRWAARKVITIPAEPADPDLLPRRSSRSGPSRHSSATSTCRWTTAGCTCRAGAPASSNNTTSATPPTRSRPARSSSAASTAASPTPRHPTSRWAAGRRWSRSAATAAGCT
jgi:selenium-binding protein 1